MPESSGWTWRRPTTATAVSAPARQHRHQRRLGRGLSGTSTTLVSQGCLTGAHDIPVTEVSAVTSVVTNKTPSGAYRGDRPKPSSRWSGPSRRWPGWRASTRGQPAPPCCRLLAMRVRDALGRAPRRRQPPSGLRPAVELGDKALDAREPARRRSTHPVGVGFASFVEPTGPRYYGTTGFWRSTSALVRSSSTARGRHRRAGHRAGHPEHDRCHRRRRARSRSRISVVTATPTCAPTASALGRARRHRDQRLRGQGGGDVVDRRPRRSPPDPGGQPGGHGHHRWKAARPGQRGLR